jgi:hypothetical protein
LDAAIPATVQASGRCLRANAKLADATIGVFLLAEVVDG